MSAEKPVPESERIWEIDFLRGLAIILMVGYHLLYDLGAYVGLRKFLGLSTDLFTPAWTAAQYFFAALFVVLSGISSTLTRSNIRRGMKLLAVSLAVTAVTYAFDSTSAIWFGILQCLGVSILVYGAAYAKAGPLACGLWGAAIIGLAPVVTLLKKSVVIPFDWLLPFGLYSPSFSSFDYFPLIPWFGIFLIGTALGKTVYASRSSRLPWTLPSTFVNMAGRYSLWIYLIHQPAIMVVLYLFKLVH